MDLNFKRVYQELKELDVGKVIKNEPMYKHTTYKVGGPARVYVEPDSIESLRQVLDYCRSIGSAYMVIGKGSDLLFSDREYEGVIISLNHFDKVDIRGNIVKAQAGVSLIALAYQAAKYGLSGFELQKDSFGRSFHLHSLSYIKSSCQILKQMRQGPEAPWEQRKIYPRRTLSVHAKMWHLQIHYTPCHLRGRHLCV